MVKEKNQGQNIFSRAYNFLEDKYVQMSNWLTEKGIPLNDLNNYLEEKGLPAFAIILSVLLLIILIILFLIFFSSKTTLFFEIKDFQSNQIDNAYLIISSQEKEFFKGVIENNSSRKIKLKIGDAYYFKATKEGMPEFLEQFKINDKKQTISINFSESVEYATLKVKLKDRENKKTISAGSLTANYNVNNKLTSSKEIVDIYNDHFITIQVPLNKDIELLVKADGYEDYKETNFRMSSELQEKIIEMDLSSLSFEGKSKVTFIVLDTSEKLIDGAEVSVFNLLEEEIAVQKTIDGKALAYIETGETITYRVKKENYKTFISDENVSIRILNPEETFTIVLELGGNILDVSVRSRSNFLALEDALVTLYNQNNNIIDSNKTNVLGEINFKGLNVDSDVLVVSCKQDFLCSNKLVNLNQETKTEFLLERIDVTNSAILNIFVVDEKNMPVSKAAIKIYELLAIDTGYREVPYNTSLQTDIVGSLAQPLRINTKYRVYAMVGESEVFEDITIDPLRENKIIFMVDNASKMIKLDLYDENGFKLNDGHLLIKTKDGTVLYDQNLSVGEDIIFNSQGYKDFIAEYTDKDGKTSVINFNADEADSSGYIRKDFNKEVNTTDYPIIEFSGIVDMKGIKTNYITTDQEYYLVFDVLFPENTYKGEVHIRAGEDTQNDSEQMSYGITGFMAMDITNFRYGTTYNPEPAPGMQAIDMLNEGSSQVLNKWLELKWISDRELGNKQIKIKVNAIDSSITKLTFKYRTLFEENKLYFRDPIDPILNQSYSTNQKFALYADTKEIKVDLFNVPLDCREGKDTCVSYTFIDSRENEFKVDDFFAVTGESYALKTSIYSFKNTQLNLLAETSKAFPLISLNLFNDNLSFTDTSFDLQNTEVTRDGFSVPSNSLKEVYLSFIAKEIGTAYIDLKATDSILQNPVVNDRLSFNIYDKKEMRVVFTPDIFIQYGSNFTIEVYDSLTSKPIENAFITFYDEMGRFISSQRAIGSVGKNGRYTIENNFNVSKVNVVIESYGYSPYKRDLFIVDDSLLIIEPREILVNLGLDQMVSSKSFSLTNNGEYIANNIRFGEPIWIDGSDEIFIDVRGPTTINRNSTQGFEVIVTVSNDLKFNQAYAKVPIYVTVGSREVTKIVPVRINKGLLLSECLEITPVETNTFVGLNLKYTPPNVFNTSFNSNNYSGMASPQNPLLAPSQRFSNYPDYLHSQNNTINYSSSPDVISYTDPNYYTYRASAPTTNQNFTQNTTFFKITNRCNETITFTPQAVLASSTSNTDLEIEMPHVTVMPGEVKDYDVIIKNKSNRTQKTTFKYDILWHNNFYSVSPSRLNIDLLDLSKALMVIPQRIDVPISQIHPQQPALNATRFQVKNIGSVPITDIQVSRYPKQVSSNIGVSIYPLEIPVLMPGSTVPVDLQFQVNMAKSTIDDIVLMVTGKAAGINDPIHATTHVIFTISAPNCLKISTDKLNFNLKVGETRQRNLTLTNNCMEPVSVIGIDKKQDMYVETVGDNPLRIFPTSGGNIIYPNQSKSYAIELKAASLGGSPNMPVVILGTLLSSNNPVSSEIIQISVNIDDVGLDEQKDRDVSIISSLPICENPQTIENFSRPQISVGACSESSGYCDAYSSAELILKKINEFQSQIKQFSSQAQSKTLNTGCPVQDAARGFCKISELGGDIMPLEFSFYMQNDLVSPELIRHVLNKSNYSFKNYYVETNPFNTAGSTSLGVYAGGNKIFVSNQFAGCGRYKVELDGFIAASSDMIYPDRAYYFINVIEYKQTENCEKDIINYLNYIPWNLPLSKNLREGTWLTLFTGDENLSKDLIRGVGYFNKDKVDERYVYQRDVLSTRNSTLKLFVDEIVENPDALAKLTFNDTKLYDRANPEQINIIFNNKYQNIDGKIPEPATRNFTNVISSMLSKNDFSAKVCISEDNTYMLILDVVKAGDLTFVSKDPSIVLNENESCLSLKIRSSIDETLKITSSSLLGLDVGFKLNENDSLNNTINLSVSQNKDANFFMCALPKSFDQLQTLVGEKITVKATSIFSKDGTIGNRNTSVDVTLKSCGITPEELLLNIYNEVLTEHNKNEDKQDFPRNVYALVDWSKSYNDKDKEELCDTLEKFITSGNYLKNEKLFFNYNNIGCDIKESDQKQAARMNKGLINAGTYYARCIGGCALCYGLSAALIPASVGGAVLDCGVFSCGLPALQVLASSLTDGQGGIGYLLDRFIGFMANSDEFKFFGPLFNRVGEWITGAIGSLTAGVLKTGSSAAAAPVGLSDVVLNIQDDFVTTAGAPGGVPAPGVPGVLPLSPSEITALNNQFNNLERYARGTAGTKISFIEGATGDKAKLITYLNKTGPASSGDILTRLGRLSSAEIDDLTNIVGRSNYSGPASGWVRPDTLSDKLFRSQANINYGAAAPGAGAAAGAAPALPANTISITDLDTTIDTIDAELLENKKSLDALDKKIKDIQKNNSRSSVNPRKIKPSTELSSLESKQTSLKTHQDSLTKVKNGLVKAKSSPQVVPGHVEVPKDVVDDFRKLQTNVSRVSPASKSARFWRGAKGFGRSVGCGILGNVVGINALKDKGKVNLNYAIEFNNEINFEKNTLYTVEIDHIAPEGDQDFENRYVIDISPYQEQDKDIMDSMPSKRVDSCILK
jgi:hypothetical protein